MVSFINGWSAPLPPKASAFITSEYHPFRDSQISYHLQRVHRQNPGTCGRKVRIAGHRIRVLDIVAWHEHHGMSPDEIVSQFPTLTLSDVHAALAYYFDHIEEIRAEMQEERRIVEESRRNNLSLLDAKLRQARLDEASR